MSKVLKNYNTIMADHRPYFSVICPCYNSKPENIDLLIQTISTQDFPKEDIELIITDDCSTDTSYFTVIDKYKDDLNILLVSTENDAIHCPGNNRENGVQYATGEWITFIDHDDLFFGDIFKTVKDAIQETGEQYLACSNILQIDPLDNNRVLKEIKYCTNWMHGKFYNLDNLWKAYDLHFKQDLVSNEDIYISSRVHCILNDLNKKNVLWLPDFTYLWKAWPDSTSHIQYSDKLSYMEFYFYDYIDSTYGVYVDEYNKKLKEADNGEIDESTKDFYIKLFIDSILFQYFYLQSFKYNNIDWELDHEKIVKQNIRDFYARFFLGSGYLYSMACEKLDNDGTREGGYVTKIWYNSIRYSVTISCGNFIESDSFKDFISKV